MLNRSASLEIQQAFWKSCLVNLISKDTHLVISISWSYSLTFCKSYSLTFCLVIPTYFAPSHTQLFFLPGPTHLVFAWSYSLSVCLVLLTDFLPSPIRLLFAWPHSLFVWSYSFTFCLVISLTFCLIILTYFLPGRTHLLLVCACVFLCLFDFCFVMQCLSVLSSFAIISPSHFICFLAAVWMCALGATGWSVILNYGNSKVFIIKHVQRKSANIVLPMIVAYVFGLFWVL